MIPCALAGAVVLGACEDKRIKAIDTGITRDSAVSIIAHDLPANAKSDSFPNVYWRDRYLIAGKNYEVLYFTPRNEKLQNEKLQPGKDTLWGKFTPIVLMNNKTIGTGWKFWDSVSTANKIPLKKR
jgi:hypothetical protein